MRVSKPSLHSSAGHHLQSGNQVNWEDSSGAEKCPLSRDLLDWTHSLAKVPDSLEHHALAEQSESHHRAARCPGSATTATRPAP